VLIIRKINCINPLNAELNPICFLLALLGTHHILHVSRIRVNMTSDIWQLCRLPVTCAGLDGTGTSSKPVKCAGLDGTVTSSKPVKCAGLDGTGTSSKTAHLKLTYIVAIYQISY
jgi:hypothetical protein